VDTAEFPRPVSSDSSTRCRLLALLPKLAMNSILRLIPLALAQSLLSRWLS
jgi:hypothetical protein